MSEDQCAVGSDGKLLDEKQISWFNDPDDTDPIPTSMRASSSTATSCVSSTDAPLGLSTRKATKIHSYFTGGPSPAVLVAGARRSGRVPKPSKRLLEGNDDITHTEIAKRARISRRPVVDSEPEDNSGAPNTSDAGGDTDVEMVDPQVAQHAYMATKGMGDQDRNVSNLGFTSDILTLIPVLQALAQRSKSDRTDDIRTIFKREKGHVNAATDALEDGHICTLCKYVFSPYLLVYIY